MERQFETVKLGDIKSWLYQRTAIDYNANIGATLTEIAESIKDKGVIEPIILRRLDNGDIQGIAGYLRYLACEKVGVKEVPAIVYAKLDDLEATDILITENLDRQEMADIDVSNVLARYVDAGIKNKDIAKRIHKSPTYVSRYLSLLKDSEPIRKALSEKTEAFTEKHARYVRKLPEPLHAKAVKAVKGKTIKETRKVVKEIKEKNKAEMVKAQIKDLEERLKEIEKAEDEKRGLEEQIAKLTGEAKALRFENVDIQRLVAKIERLQLRYLPTVERLTTVKARMKEIDKVMPTYDIEQVKKQRERVYTNLGKAKAKVKKLQKQLKTARVKAKEFQKEANKLTESIEYAVSLKREMAKLKDEKKKLETTVKDFESHYSDEIKNFENLKATVNNANKEIMEKREAIFKTVAELKAKIRSLNGKIASRKMVEKRLEQLKAEL